MKAAYIRKEIVVKYLREWRDQLTDNMQAFNDNNLTDMRQVAFIARCRLDEEIRRIKALPPAEVQPNQLAVWRYQTMTVPGGKGQTYAKWGCSRCREKVKVRSPFCPYCGAKMRDEDEL